MKKYLILTSLAILALCGFLIYQLVVYNDGKLHIVFCDVGQGDAVLIRTPGNKYILYDAGPDKRVLACLSRHMPVWQREIDLAILSHPHTDHFMGYYYVLERYAVKALATEQLDNQTPGFQMVMERFKQKRIPITNVLGGDSFQIEKDVLLSVEGPSREYLNQTSPGGKIGESKEFASVIVKVAYKEFSVLLTGDSQASGLEQFAAGISVPVSVLQVPHHGSATGLTSELVQKLAPQLAVVSVGKNNYGHPSLPTLYLLKDLPLKRTDKDGDIEIVTDGEGFSL
jgi:competence protein ComEC